MHLPALWKNIKSRLDAGQSTWRRDIERLGQVQAVKERSKGKAWSDDEVFEALLMAVLSSETVWSRIEKVRPRLMELFSGFSLGDYARRQESDIIRTITPWFEERKAGSMNLRASLVNLICTAGILLAHSRDRGSAESYFTELMEEQDNDPKQVALCLGVDGSRHKLPSLGVTLAAEALKNLGFDVAKPDRHVCRAVAAFGLVDFRPAGPRYESPAPTKLRQGQTMTKVEDIAKAVRKRVAFVDNAIWLLGAESGLRLTNLQLSELAGDSHWHQEN